MLKPMAVRVPAHQPPGSNRARWKLLSAVVAAFAVVSSVLGVTILPDAQAASPGVGLFGPSVVPAVPAVTSTESVNLGVRFSADQDGTISSVAFYRGPEQKGTYTASLWSAEGALLARTTFPAMATAGWQTAGLGKTVRIKKGLGYVVSYLAAGGRHPVTPSVFAKVYSNNGLTVPVGGGLTTVARDNDRPETSQTSNYLVDVVFVPASTTTTSPAPSSSPSTTTPTPSPVTTTPTPSPVSPGPLDRNWPNASNTGVPDGVKLTAYTGPCTIAEDNTVIDAQLVSCDRLRIIADNVTIKRSRINGRIDTPDPQDPKYSFSFRIEDSEVHVGNVLGITAIKQANFHANRIEVTGGARSIYCDSNCVIENSWVHGQASDPLGEAHTSGVRMDQDLVLRHNTLVCESIRLPGKGACSAALTGYGDWRPVQNNLIENNLFQPGSASNCAYGGSSGGKPYSGDARDIRFINNVFMRGATGRCGLYNAVFGFDDARPGNVWQGNIWDDGTPVAHN